MFEEKIEYEKGSGNVFKDLGFPDAEEYQAKARIALIIGDIVAESGLRRGKVAKILGIKKSEVTALLDGLLDDFSLDCLFSFIRKLDCSIEIVVRGKPTRKPAEGIHISMPF